MKLSIKDHFITYLNSYGGDANTMELGRDLIVSFAGSDGPSITRTGLKEGKTFIAFSDTKKIDKYLVEGCKDNYYTQNEDLAAILPSRSWTDYYKKNCLGG